jgi:hypothetical protein
MKHAVRHQLSALQRIIDSPGSWPNRDGQDNRIKDNRHLRPATFMGEFYRLRPKPLVPRSLRVALQRGQNLCFKHLRPRNPTCHKLEAPLS